MRPGADSATTRNGKPIILAYDHGRERGPSDFDPVPETADPEAPWDPAAQSTVTAFDGQNTDEAPETARI